MATNLRKSSEDRDKALRDELNKLLGGQMETSDPFNESEGTLDDLPEPMTEEKIHTAPPMNITELDIKFKKQAKSIISSMYDFYFDMGVLDRPEYIEKKKTMDSMNLSNMLFMLKSVKFAISRILDEINAGNMNPKLIENFCTLSSQMSSLTKDHANYVLFLEESVKKSKIETMEHAQAKKLASPKESLSIPKKIEDISEIEEEKDDTSGKDEIDEAVKKDEESSKYFLTSDPMILIDTIHRTDMTYEDVKEERSDYLKERGDVERFVDYSNKNDLVNEYDVDASAIIDSDDTLDDSDLLEMI